MLKPKLFPSPAGPKKPPLRSIPPCPPAHLASCTRLNKAPGGKVRGVYPNPGGRAPRRREKVSLSALRGERDKILPPGESAGGAPDDKMALKINGCASAFARSLPLPSLLWLRPSTAAGARGTLRPCAALPTRKSLSLSLSLASPLFLSLSLDSRR